MTIYPFRYDYLGLSSEDKPQDLVDGTTFYEVDTSKFFIWYNGQWYEQS